MTAHERADHAVAILASWFPGDVGIQTILELHRAAWATGPDEDVRGLMTQLGAFGQAVGILQNLGYVEPAALALVQLRARFIAGSSI